MLHESERTARELEVANLCVFCTASVEFKQLAFSAVTWLPPLAIGQLAVGVDRTQAEQIYVKAALNGEQPEPLMQRVCRMAEELTESRYSTN